MGSRVVVGWVSLLVLFLPAAVGGLGSCGGGGATDPACELPGVLRALAVQGEGAPGTTGNFAAFTTTVPMDVATSGYAVFVAATTDGAKSSVLYAADQDGTLLEVFALGDVAPDAGVQTITGFLATPLKVAADGRILCGVTLSGGGSGLLTARISGGAIVDEDSAILTGVDMSSSGVAGLLTSVDGPLCWLAEGGKVFFAGSTSAGVEAFWLVNANGTGLDKLVAEGDAVGGANDVADLLATAITLDGGRYAFAAQTASGDEGVYSAAPADSAATELLLEGDTLPGGGFATDAFDGRPIIVYPAGSAVWGAKADVAGSIEDVILVGAPALPVVELAREGDPAPQTTAGVDYGNLTLLAAPLQAPIVMWKADLVGAPTTSDVAIYAYTSLGTLVVVYESRGAPESASGGTFGDVFPGLLDTTRRPVGADGSLAFANLLSTGVSGVFWVIPDCGLFTVARVNGSAPGGDLYGAFSPASAQTLAGQVLLFRASLQSAGSGIFRRGP